MKRKLRAFLDLMTETYAEWSADNALRLSAALAYYALFSLAPLLIIIVSLAGLVLGEKAAKGEVAVQIHALAGKQAADAIQSVVQGTGKKSASIVATIIGLVVLLFGASGVFGELKAALNTIWGVALRPGRVWTSLIRERFLSFSLVLGIGFLLLISLALSAAISAVTAYMGSRLPIPRFVLPITDIVLSFAIITILFALIFKILPNVIVGWTDVFVGAVGTAFLFTIGKFLLGIYLGKSSVTSYYGAAGSAVIILLWIYYSTCILFFGAEFTKVYARMYGSGIVPDKRAMPYSEVLHARLEKEAAIRQSRLPNNPA